MKEDEEEKLIEKRKQPSRSSTKVQGWTQLVVERQVYVRTSRAAISGTSAVGAYGRLDRLRSPLYVRSPCGSKRYGTVRTVLLVATSS